MSPPPPLLFGLQETGLDDYRSQAEREFLEALHLRSQAAGWFGEAWPQPRYLTVTVTLFAATGSTLRRTLRIDFGGSSVVVGDDPTHQLVDDMDRSRPDVFEASGQSIPELATFAADWIEREIAAERSG
jgi:hypothetical protein